MPARCATSSSRSTMPRSRQRPAIWSVAREPGGAGLDRNTVVVFTSDHGEEFLDHGDYGHGQTLYRELIGVPLVIRMPDRSGAGRRTDATAQHIDLLPTIVELAGGESPAWAHGTSLVPALTGAARRTRARSRGYLQLDTVSVASLVVGDWHLLRRPMDGALARLEMFNLASDAGEIANVRAENAVLAGLQLTEWRRNESEETALFDVDVAEVDPEVAARLRDLGYIR